ncbi:MAG: MxaS protein [Proteobacteria bacterium ST_bin11]|nr:MAG: MxaS protein [Proteobacteria bacterium ST_bin11]
MSANIHPFQYRLPRPVVGAFPGAHPGQMVGNGQLFKRHDTLIARPDPRRIDLRASLLDPFGNYQVRVQQQHSAVDVFLLADFSASMGFSGNNEKRSVLADMLLSIAASALEYGDSFGFIACNQQVLTDCYLPAGKHIGRIQSVAERLQKRAMQPGFAGLLHAQRYLPNHRALVFLVSDFHFPLPHLQAVLRSLSRHDVIPLVLWDQAEYSRLPDWGLFQLQDLETGRRRTLWLRPGLKRKIEQAFAQRRSQLQRHFRAFGCEPLFIENGYRSDQLAQYFLGRAG